MDALQKTQTESRPTPAAEAPAPVRPPASEAKPVHSRDRIAQAAALLKFKGDLPTTQVSQPSTTDSPRDAQGIPTQTAVDAPAPDAAQTAAEPAAEKPTTTQRVTPQYVEVIRKQKELDRRLAEAKKAEKAAKDLQAQLADWEKDPLSAAAKRAGKTPEEIYADLTMRMVNPQAAAKKDKTTELESKLEAITKKIADYETQMRTANENTQIAQAKAAVKNHLAQNAEKYEITAAEEAWDTVYEVMLQHYGKTGDVLPLDKACEMTEAYFEEHADKLLKLKKVQSKLSTRPETSAPQTGAVTASRTLTNGHTQALPVRANPKLSREDRIKEATRLLRFIPNQ